MPIGHDIVSLKEDIPALTKKHGKKTLHFSETHYWQAHHYSSLFYWSCWAIKEAVYKLNMKVQFIDPLIFPHFDTKLASLFQEQQNIDYSLQFQNQTIFIKLVQEKSYVQAFASTIKLSCKNFTSFISEKKSLNPSQEVQKLVTDSIADSSIKFQPWKRRARIPFLYLNNQYSKNHDISFSHDGFFHSSCILNEENKQ